MKYPILQYARFPNNVPFELCYIFIAVDRYDTSF